MPPNRGQHFAPPRAQTVPPAYQPSLPLPATSYVYLQDSADEPQRPCTPRRTSARDRPSDPCIAEAGVLHGDLLATIRACVTPPETLSNLRGLYDLFGTYLENAP